ncbi:type IV secretory system conjugative DNA transfer family protein [Dactylosporangium sp. CS-047395]|uniref:type IV secretory system conjugative DNA transfer family protein n=1 Tax=Dactylosporangium sp. CS-047395 TaxID=3239936 RepID=UPI003D89B679
MHPCIVLGPTPVPIPPPPLLPAPSQRLLDAVTAAAGWCWHRPWLAVLPVLLAAAAVIARTVIASRRHERMTRRARLITVSPPPQVDPDGAATCWATLAELLRTGLWRRLRHGRPHLAFEYRWQGRELTIAVWVPGTVHPDPVLAACRGAWPGAACTVTDAEPPLPLDATAATGGALTPVLPAWYPLRSDHDQDPLRTLLAAASGLRPGQSACVQVLTRPATRRQLRMLRRGVLGLRTGRPPRAVLDPATWLGLVLDLGAGLVSAGRRRFPAGRPGPVADTDPQRDRDARAGVDKLASTPWEVALRYGVADADPRGGDPAERLPRLVVVAQGMAAAFGAWTGRNRLRQLPVRQPAQMLAGRVLRAGFLLSAAELAAIAALPLDVAVPGLDRARARPMPAPVAVASGGRGTKVLGRADVGGHSVALHVADARQHLHVLGSTGSGKSTLLSNMILDDIHARRGVVVIDPKGDLILDLLDRIPASHARRLTIIDPDQPAGTTLNPLQGDDHDLVVDNIVSIFGRIFAKHWGPRIDDTMRVACLTLLRKANATLTLIPPLLNDRQFRHAFTEDLDDPEGLRGYWEWFEATPPPLRAQVIGPVLARLRAFLLRDFVRRTLGAPRSSFDMRRVLDGGILLARLPKGQLGEETARLMGSFVLASAWQAAISRARLPEAERRDCFAYIDEAQNFLTLPGSVGDMLAEARGYRLGLVLAHQNLAQMPRETQLAISANARNKVFFSCAPEDARQLARHTTPELDEHDLSHLDAYRAACRLVVASRETAAFTLRTNPARPVVGEATAVRQAAARANSGGDVSPAIAALAGGGRRPEPATGEPTTGAADGADGTRLTGPTRRLRAGHREWIADRDRAG